MRLLLEKYYPTFLLLILGFAFFTRVINLHQPEGYMFDEVYHAVTAKLIAKNDARAYEWWNPPPEADTAVDWLHPPIAKYTQAFMIQVFGENAFAWRLSSAIFGVGVIWLTALLAKELFNNKAISLLAALIASLDGLLLVQSRIAMNDIHVTFFILLTFLFYYKHYKFNKDNATYTFSKYLVFAGISGGFAAGTKWSGVFSLATIGMIELVVWVHFLYLRYKVLEPSALIIFGKNALQIIFSLFILPAAIYYLAYSHMFIQGKGISHFFELHHQIWQYQTQLEATHPYQSRPWQWFLNLRPVWFAVEYVSQTVRGNIYSFGNPAVFLFGALSVVWTTAYLLFKKSTSASKQPLFFLLIAYFMVWLPWQLSPRVMFFYHYTPAVPLLAIILSYWLVKLEGKRNILVSKLFIIALLIMITCFLVWYPHWTNIPVSTEFINNVYFFLDSWK